MTKDMGTRILSLDFDHDVFRMWPTSSLTRVGYILMDEPRLHAAVKRLDTIESADVSDIDCVYVTTMLRTCYKRKRGHRPPKMQSLFRVDR